MSGVTKLDRIRNERIRGTTKVEEISKKVQESRLKWYGHVLRREDEYIGKRVMAMEVPGEKKERKTKAEVVGSPQHKHWPTGSAHFSDRRASTGQYIVSFTGPAGPPS